MPPPWKALTPSLWLGAQEETSLGVSEAGPQGQAISLLQGTESHTLVHRPISSQAQGASLSGTSCHDQQTHTHKYTDTHGTMGAQPPLCGRSSTKALTSECS
ncbi:unnamed protein product [Rangifer tarandus platyrhynchus]|uniref:Uncharacterized protein n=2 Tax=Rangifer tarandus platyrhynchus TaxID=3082113 RepID=A0AC59ZI77_RANTA|nr:unnamed protein product [Rangifer tarandus platyrhynchus]